MTSDFPLTPRSGDTWIGPNGFEYLWNGSTWDAVTPHVAGTSSRIPKCSIMPTPPTGPLPSDFWYSSENGYLYIWYDDGNTAQWVVANPGRGGTTTPGPAGAQGPVGPQGPIGLTGVSGTSAVVIAPNLAALRDSITDRPPLVVTQGYYAPGDGGGGPPWQWIAGSTAAADNFLVVTPAGTPAGRYIRQLQAGDSVSPKWAGAGLDLTGATNDTARFQVVLNASGAHAVDISGCTLYLTGNSVDQASSCPGIFSNGSGTVKCFNPGGTGGTNSGSFLISVYKSDFYVDRIFFDMPISTTATSPPVSAVVAFEPPTPAAPTDRQRFTNCYMRGGNGFSARNTSNNANLYILNNTFTDVWGNATAILGYRNCYFQGNTAERCCYTEIADAAFHFSNVYTDILADELIVTGNIVRDCFPTGIEQESMDFHGINIRNVVIANNICDRTPHGGFEFKSWPSTTSPPVDFYGDVLIANNLFNFMDTPGKAGIGIAMNNLAPPDHKQARFKITGNQFLCDVTTNHGAGIVVDGYDGVEITDNTFANLETGILVTAAGAPSQTAYNILIQGNYVNTIGSGIVTGRNIVNLAVKDNVIRCPYHTLFLYAVCSGLICTGNDIDVLGGSDYAVVMNTVTNGLFAYNTIKSNHAAMYFDTGVCTNVMVSNNIMTSVYGVAVNSNSPTLTICNNEMKPDYSVPSVRFLGAGAGVAYNNWRPSSAGITPQGAWAGARGDIVTNSTPTAGGIKEWVCVTGGDTTTSVWKPVAIGA